MDAMTKMLCNMLGVTPEQMQETFTGLQNLAQGAASTLGQMKTSLTDVEQANVIQLAQNAEIIARLKHMDPSYDLQNPAPDERVPVLQFLQRTGGDDHGGTERVDGPDAAA